MTAKDIRWIQRFNNFDKALSQLTKFIEKGELNEMERQGLIQSFEYNYELACDTFQYLRQFLAKRSATLYLAVKSAIQPPDVRGEIAIQDFGEGIDI